MTTINELYTLTTLLPSTTFSLAYSLPLLFLSLLVTFSGTFFTLDRTRQFAPKDDLLPGAFDSPKRKPKWLLEGGIGGLAIGYSFGGMHSHRWTRNLLIVLQCTFRHSLLS